MIARPEVEGVASIRSEADAFFRAFRQRVADGLLTGRPHPRSRYVVTGGGPDRLEIRAADWWSAMNVGLNRVELRLVEPGRLGYRVRYWRWTLFALGLSGAMGLAGIVALTTLDVRGYIASHAASMIPGLSIEQNLRVLWAMALFWGFVWPWILVSLHKRPLHRLMARLIAEADAGHVPSDGRAHRVLP